MIEWLRVQTQENRVWWAAVFVNAVLVTALVLFVLR